MLGDLLNGEEGRAFAFECSAGDGSRENEFVLLDTALPFRVKASAEDVFLAMVRVSAPYPLLVRVRESALGALLARVTVSAANPLFSWIRVSVPLALAAAPGSLIGRFRVSETHACDSHCFLAEDGNLQPSSSFL